MDGSQHLETAQADQDQHRTTYLEGCGLRVLRVGNLDVLRHLEAVLQQIFEAVRQAANPPQPGKCR